MKKYLVKSVYKRMLIVAIIYMILTIFSSYLVLSNENFGVDYTGNLFIGYLITLFAHILAGIALIFGYIDLKKTFKSVSLKDLVLLSLVLSFLFSIISYFVILLIYFKIKYGIYIFTTIWYIPLIAFIGYFLLYWVVIYLISFWIIFKRAGEKGWAFLVPFYNIIIMLKITKKPEWWFFLFLIPFVNIVFACMVNFELAKKFNKYDDFALGTAILPIIFYPFIAFGKDEYQK